MKRSNRLIGRGLAGALLAGVALSVRAVNPHLECIDKTDASDCDSNCNCPPGGGPCCLQWSYSVKKCFSCIPWPTSGSNKCSQSGKVMDPSATYILGDCMTYQDPFSGEPTIYCACVNFTGGPYSLPKPCECSTQTMFP